MQMMLQSKFCSHRNVFNTFLWNADAAIGGNGALRAGAIA